MINSEDNMSVTIPTNWQMKYGNPDGIFEVSRSTDEYDQVLELVKSSQTLYRIEVDRIQRIQNYNFYCQFLCRLEYYGGCMVHYYTVRKFVCVSKHKLSIALQYNLDPRRLNIDKLILHQKLNSYISDDYVLLVVKVLTSSPQDDCCNPLRSTDYYIEYVVYLD